MADIGTTGRGGGGGRRLRIGLCSWAAVFDIIPCYLDPSVCTHCVCVCVCVCVCECVWGCVCVCVRAREREKERDLSALVMD